MTRKIATHIDEGHGGSNTGTHDAELVEKDIVLEIGDRMSRIHGGPISMSRSRSFDVDVSQSERGAASMRGAAIFVGSVHVNDCPDPSVGGVQLYVGRNNHRTFGLAHAMAPYWEELFGTCKVVEAYKPKDPDEPGISEEKRAKRLEEQWIEHPWAIIRAHVADVILFEIGFRRNERDRQILLSEMGREEIATMLRLSFLMAARTLGG